MHQYSSPKKADQVSKEGLKMVQTRTKHCKTIASGKKNYLPSASQVIIVHKWSCSFAGFIAETVFLEVSGKFFPWKR